MTIKEFIQGIRDKKNFFLMIFMPTILIMVLSTVLDNGVEVKKEINNLTVKFINDRKEFINLNIDKLEKNLERQGFNINYKSSFKNYNKEKDIFIEKNKNNEINLYCDKSIKLEGLVVENIIKSFSNNIKVEYNDMNHIILKNIYNFDNSYIINNYGISMITLTILFASVTGAYSLIKEKNNGTIKKLLTLSISIKDIIIGKFLGSLTISSIQIIIVVTISNNFLNISFGENILLIIILLIAEAGLAISFGTIVGCFINDNKSCWMLLLTTIMIFGLLGGAFVPFNKMNSNILKYISNLSPITYINNSVFNIIFLNDKLLAEKVILIFLFITVIFLIGAIRLLGGKNESIYSCV